MEVHLEKKRGNLQNKMEVTILEPQLLGKWEDPQALLPPSHLLSDGPSWWKGWVESKENPWLHP